MRKKGTKRYNFGFTQSARLSAVWFNISLDSEASEHVPELIDRDWKTTLKDETLGLLGSFKFQSGTSSELDKMQGISIYPPDSTDPIVHIAMRFRHNPA